MPLDDEISSFMELAILEAKRGVANYSNMGSPEIFYEGSGYRGFHTTECGEDSDNLDYQLKNGMITNSLAPFYLRFYRNSIPDSEMLKVNELINFYKDKK